MRPPRFVCKNFVMSSPRPYSSRWALWVFAAALLLKAAMPLLATLSAHVQGKAVAEVCSVSGVATVPLSGDGQPLASSLDTHAGSSHHPPAHGQGNAHQSAQESAPENPHGSGQDHAPDHGGGHCALTALTALAAAALVLLALVAPVARGTPPRVARRLTLAPDPCAAWIARLRHGPPRVA